MIGTLRSAAYSRRMETPPWLGRADRLQAIGGWPEREGGMVLGPFLDRTTGESIVKLEAVHPSKTDATVLFGNEGRTAMVRLRFNGVVGFPRPSLTGRYRQDRGGTFRSQ